MMVKRPTRAFSVPSRPRRKKRRAVAPMPPPNRNPAPSAPAATAGRFARSFAETLVASPISSRSSSTACASWSRSCSMSRRTCSAVLPLAAIALQRLLRELRLADRLLGNRRSPLLHAPAADQREHERDEEQEAGDDQQRRPRREERCESGCDRGEREPQREQAENGAAHEEPGADSERGDLALQLERRKLELELNERFRMLGDVLDNRSEAATVCVGRPADLGLSVWGGHVPSSRSTSKAQRRRTARRRRSRTGSGRRRRSRACARR